MSGPPSHEWLCAQALSGDRAAWEALIALHTHRVVLALLAAGVRADRARDLAQDVWVRLIDQQRRGRLPRLQLPGLALTQARFLGQMDARRERQRSAAAQRDGPLEVEDSAEGRLLSAEQLRQAQRLLAECSASARAVFGLVYEHPELTHAEVAERVGLSTQRVRQILCEVRKRLRGALRGGLDG